MKYEFSSAFFNADFYSNDISEIWTSLCYDVLIHELGQRELMRLQSREYGIDISHQSSGTAFICLAVNNPAEETPSADVALASIAFAEKYHYDLKWKRLALCTNAPFSREAMAIIVQEFGKQRVEAGELGFLGPDRWGTFVDKYPNIVSERFNYRVRASIDDVVNAFEGARYIEQYIKEYVEKTQGDDYHVILTNNRNAVEIEIPFSPELTVESLVDISLQLLDISLESSNYPDLNTSARLSISAVVSGSALPFRKKLSEIPIHSGGFIELFIRIIWKKEDPKSSDQFIPDRQIESTYLDFSLSRAISFRLVEDGKGFPASQQPRSQSLKDETISRKESGLVSTIWQQVTKMIGPSQARVHSTGDQILSPVRLGASAPRSVAPGSSFLARFVAYHADLESIIAEQLQSLSPEAAHKLDYGRANWTLGTKVEIHAYGKDLQVDPSDDQFIWGGEKHILDFRVHVEKDASGPCDLKFDLFVDGLRVSRVWIEIDISLHPNDERRSISVSTPRTAFASYASLDRLRVLDRVSSLEIHCGVRVFLDCVSIRPNAK